MSSVHFLHVIDQWLHSIGRPAASPDDKGVVLLEFASGGAFSVRPRPDGQLEMSANIGAGDSYAIHDIARSEEAEEGASPSLPGESLAILAWNDDDDGLWQLEANTADSQMYMVWEGPQPESLADWMRAMESFEGACAHWQRTG